MRVLGLPVPQVPTHRLQVFPSLEPELLLRKGGVRGEVRNVARSGVLLVLRCSDSEKQSAPSRGNLSLEIVSSGLAHRLDDIIHALTSPTTEVVRLVASVTRFEGALEHTVRQRGRLIKRIESEPVAAREVHDMQIVAHAGAVVCWVVIAKHLEGRVFHAPDGHVSEQWEEITRSSFWFLADESRGVCPGWAVEGDQEPGGSRGSERLT